MGGESWLLFLSEPKRRERIYEVKRLVCVPLRVVILEIKKESCARARHDPIEMSLQSG